MNFTSFSGHIPATLPNIHQFAAKLAYEGGTATQLVQVHNPSSTRSYQTATNVAHFNQLQNTLIRQGDNVVVSINNGPNSLAVLPPMQPGLSTMNQEFCGHLSIPYSHLTSVTADDINILKEESPISEHSESTNRDYSNNHQEQRENLMTQQNNGTVLQMHQSDQQQPVIHTTHSTGHPQQLVVVLAEQKPKHEMRISDGRETRISGGNVSEFISAVPWPSLATAPGVADYISLGLQHLLKYTGDKRDDVNNLITAVAANGLNNVVSTSSVVVQAPQLNSSGIHQTVAAVHGQHEECLIAQPTNSASTNPPKKKKKKPAKEYRPRPKPGEIRLTTALDGSTLYCCPECHMAYPERPLLEQHLLGHTMERKYICDICNAALKRKDHLTRHKQSHNPERPFVCSVCLKAFKRKEQLTLHTVIHTGEKRHVCNECGKGFYRKDHLRKHTRSHIARRVKAEMSQSGNNEVATIV